MKDYPGSFIEQCVKETGILHKTVGEIAVDIHLLQDKIKVLEHRLQVYETQSSLFNPIVLEFYKQRGKVMPASTQEKKVVNND